MGEAIHTDDGTGDKSCTTHVTRVSPSGLSLRVEDNHCRRDKIERQRKSVEVGAGGEIHCRAWLPLLDGSLMGNYWN